MKMSWTSKTLFWLYGIEWLINRPLTPDSNRGDGDDLRLGDVERRKLFGEDGGKAIMGILEHDKIAKREVMNRQAPGLRF